MKEAPRDGFYSKHRSIGQTIKMKEEDDPENYFEEEKKEFDDILDIR